MIASIRQERVRSRALRWLYTCISSGLALVCVPSLLLCLGKERRLRANERWGRHGKDFKARLGRKAGRRFWIHAVSVGEVDVALHLIRALHNEDPHADFVLTTVTCEGHRLAAKCTHPSVHVSYAPLDFAGTVRRSFRAFDPDVLLLVEIEIWPHQLWEARRLGVPVAVVNGRLPAGDLKKYRWVSWFMRDIFGLLSLTCVQASEDAEAYREMGVALDRIKITGSLKMDAALGKAGRPTESGFPWDEIASRTVLVGASTHAGEEEILFDITTRLKTEFTRFLLVVAPRHPSRVEQVMRDAAKRGLTALRWSQLLAKGHGPGENIAVIVIDTLGDLARCYAFARVVFVGKSLTARGGQNPMEPAAAGCPVLFGPFMENFDAVAQSLLRSRGAIQVSNAADLEGAILGLLRDPASADALGHSAREVVAAHAGATTRTLELLGGLSQIGGNNALC
jgi:3-deoxy-D-manno-octulosonic-acid transferase